MEEPDEYGLDKNSSGLEIAGEDDMKKKKRRKSRAASTTESEAPKKKTEYTWEQKFAAKRCGRECDSCGKFDTDPDRVEPSRKMAWGRIVVDRVALAAMSASMALLAASNALEDDDTPLKTDGSTCWYCFRVWNTCFSVTYRTLGGWKAAKVQNPNLYDLATKYMHWLVDMMVRRIEESGTRDDLMRLTWPSPAMLKVIEIREVAWTEPEEEFLELPEYTALYGDPETNGKGDKQIKGPGGIKLVTLNTSRKWKKTVRIIQQAVREQVFDDGSDETKASLSDMRFAQLKDTIGHTPLPSSSSASSSVQLALPATLPALPALISEDEKEPLLDGAASGVPQAQPAAPVPNPDAAALVLAEKVAAKAKAEAAKASGKAAAAAKAVGKAAGAKATGKAGAKKKGRPVRDAGWLLRISLKELAVAKAGSKFFTAAWRNTKRNWENYLRDINATLSSYGNDDEDEESDVMRSELKTIYAQGLAAKKVLDVVAKSGLNVRDTAVEYQAQRHWLSVQNPPAENPFSPYFVQAMHSSALQEACPPEEFWKEMEDQKVMEYFMTLAECEASQLEYFSGMILTITQEKSQEEVFRALEELCKKFWPAKDKFKGEQFVKEVFRCSVLSLSFHDTQSREEFTKDLRAMLEEGFDNVVGKALKTFPRGRAVLTRAAVKVAEYEAMSKRAGVAMSMAKAALVADEHFLQNMAQIEEALKTDMHVVMKASLTGDWFASLEKELTSNAMKHLEPSDAMTTLIEPVALNDMLQAVLNSEKMLEVSAEVDVGFVEAINDTKD